MSAGVLHFPNGARAAAKAMSLSPSKKTARSKLSSPVVEQGAGVLTVIVEVVGEELQVPADEIELKQVDSTIVPSDGGVGGSRATRVYGNASFEAGTKAREELSPVRRRKRWKSIRKNLRLTEACRA